LRQAIAMLSMDGARRAPAIVEPLARAGFAVKGIVYLLLGTLALMAALGAGGRLTDAEGVLTGLLARPFGRLAVGVLAIGLALYAAWRYLEAFADANRVGRDRGGLADRAGWAISGTVYGLLALDAGRLAFRWSAGSGVDVPTTVVASPLAPWIVTLIAAVLIVYAVKEARRALSSRFSERLNLRQLSREGGPIVVGISRAGILARAAVLASLGIVLLRGRANPARAASQTDMGDSLQLVAALPAGPWLLGLMAAGLVAYGIYQLVHARYRRIAPP
jgi:hypothetical protein